MRRAKTAALALACALALAGCGGSQTNQTIEQIAASSEAAPASPTPTPTATQAPAPTPEPEAASAVANENQANTAEVIDLTTMSATMVYAQVYDMVMAPAGYEGRVFTVTGQFVSYEGNPNNPDGAAYYYTVSVADATACCQQGLEFVLPEGAAYPTAEGETITVTGAYTPYEENGTTYYHLVAEGWSAA